MRIKPLHLAILRNAFNKVLEKYPNEKQKYITLNLTHKRFRWDVSLAVKQYLPDNFINDTLYEYLDDNHLDTAFRHILGDKFN